MMSAMMSAVAARACSRPVAGRAAGRGHRRRRPSVRSCAGEAGPLTAVGEDVLRTPVRDRDHRSAVVAPAGRAGAARLGQIRVAGGGVFSVHDLAGDGPMRVLGALEHGRRRCARGKRAAGHLAEASRDLSRSLPFNLTPRPLPEGVLNRAASYARRRRTGGSGQDDTARPRKFSLPCHSWLISSRSSRRRMINETAASPVSAPVAAGRARPTLGRSRTRLRC